MSGTWTAWADGHSRTVRQCPRRTAPVPARVAGVAMAAGQRACSPCLRRPVACGSSSSGPASGRCAARVAMSAVAAARTIPCPPVVAGVRQAAGHPSGASDRRRHRHGHRHQPWLCLPDTSRPERGGSGMQRTVNPLMVPARYNFLCLPQGRPCGRPPAALRPGNDTTLMGRPASPSTTAEAELYRDNPCRPHRPSVTIPRLHSA